MRPVANHLTTSWHGSIQTCVVHFIGFLLQYNAWAGLYRNRTIHLAIRSEPLLWNNLPYLQFWECSDSCQKAWFSASFKIKPQELIALSGYPTDSNFDEYYQYVDFKRFLARLLPVTQFKYVEFRLWFRRFSILLEELLCERLSDLPTCPNVMQISCYKMDRYFIAKSLFWNYENAK